jgi:hypothetical protein
MVPWPRTPLSWVGALQFYKGVISLDALLSIHGARANGARRH